MNSIVTNARLGRLLERLASAHHLTIGIHSPVFGDKSITTVPERAGDLEKLLTILVEYGEKHDEPT